MEIQINVAELRKNKIFVATPMFGGQCHGLYMKSCLDLQNTMTKYGVEIKYSFLFNESLIQRARNYLLAEFMRSDFTHLLFIDADIGFSSQDVIAMLALDKDIICGMYPKKAINWSNIKDAILKNPDIELSELPKLVGEYAFNIKPGTKNFDITMPVEISEAATGFLLVKKGVFTKLEQDYPELWYKPDHHGQPGFDGSVMIHSPFSVMIDHPDSIVGEGSMRTHSEDYFFSKIATKSGYQIFACPWINLTHNGTYGFTGDLPAIARYVGKL